MFKARALHYCLSPNISILSPDDWIVHLDEETLLSESVLHGITQFILDPESNIGQGVITYGETGIENWLTTLLDGIRVALDYGLFRFSMQIFHRPVFGFKGSFIVVKSEIEEEIGFDFGPKECIAEDLRFALAAWNAGYRFDFVEGVMKEKSTFSLVDFVKQRKRWFIGHFHVVWGNSLPFYCKFVVTLMHLANMFLWTNVLNTVLSFVLSVPLQKWQVCIFVLLTFNIFFSLAFGNFMSLCSRRYSFFARVVICFLSQALVPVLAIAESYSSLKGLKDRNTLTFDIVQKEKKKQLSTRNGNDFCTV
jgi:egghead protein (zeste-white 4 protein)